MKILIVEDVMLMALDLADRVTSYGYEVIGPFASGEETLKHLAEHDIRLDAAILDIEIKGSFTGISLAAELNKKTSTPIIYLTKKEDDTTLNEVIETGYTSYINKPYRDNELKAALYKALSEDFSFKIAESSDTLSDRIFVQNGIGKYLILLKDIIYLEAHGEYTKLHVINKNEPVTINGSIGKTLSKLSGSDNLFQRTFRSFAVNVERVKRINTTSPSSLQEKEKNKKYLELEGTEKLIDLSEKYRSLLMSRLKQL